MSALAGLALLLAAAGALAPGQASAPTVPTVPLPEGQAHSGGVLRDPDFRVVSRQFGLERRVEMYQWRAGQAGYDQVWNQAPIDSAGFAPGHENPPALPIQSQRWWAPAPTLDGALLDIAVLKVLGQWQVFRPGFSRLPANLAVAFQPEGDGLGTAENPLEPKIGDLRVSWLELVLPPLSGMVTMRDGTWQPKPDPVPAASPELDSAESSAATEQHAPSPARWPWLAALLLPLLGGVVVHRRRNRGR